MIFVDRNSVPVPEFFGSDEYKIKVAELRRFYRSSDRAQKRFLDYDLPAEVNKSIKTLFDSKCAYCETKFNFGNYKDDIVSLIGINHFRPKNNAKDLIIEKDKKSLEHYWWLSYEWNNLYYCCPDCMKNKSSWFPVEGKRTKLESNYDHIIKSEQNLLLDPCNDDPESHFDYNLDTGKIIPKSKKGEITIQILGLNRKHLVLKRLNTLKEEAKYLNNFDINLKNNSNIKSEYPAGMEIEYWSTIFSQNWHLDYLGIRRKYISTIVNKREHLRTIFNDKIKNWNKYLKKDTNQKHLKSNKLKKTKNLKLLKNIQLEKIELKNYKCFDNLKINFLDNTNNTNQEPWLVFLGENGVGKSSVLKAIAIALMGQKNIDKLIKSETLKPLKHLQNGKRICRIKLYSKNGEFYEVKITKNKITSNIINPTSYIIGYGSTRLLPKGNLEIETDVEYVKIKNLFDYSIALSNAKKWLLDVPTKMFDQVAISLKDLLLLDNDDTLRRNKQNDELYIKYAKGNNKIDVSDLSDGYKTIFAITVDMIKTLSKDNLAFETAEGIILIDEIGTHLHPRWKMEVVARLRKTFPKLQFIATTHEPLCLRGLGENEVIVLKKDNEGEIIAINDLPNPSEFRVDQLLTSEYFGLSSTMDFETEDLFKEYYALIAKEDDEITKEEKGRIDELSGILPNKKHLGDDIRDELVYFVIDELLAKQIKGKGYNIIDKDIQEEAKNKVKSIWEHFAKNENNL